MVDSNQQLGDPIVDDWLLEKLDPVPAEGAFIGGSTCSF